MRHCRAVLPFPLPTVVFGEAPKSLILFLVLATAGTPYEGGLFRMKIVLGEDFPTAPPKGGCT